MAKPDLGCTRGVCSAALLIAGSGTLGALASWPLHSVAWALAAGFAGAFLTLAVQMWRISRSTREMIDSISEQGWAGLDLSRLAPQASSLAASLRNLAVVTEQREHALRDVIQRERLRALEREMYSQQLEEVQERLQATNAELEAFTYSASHDLAVPLKTIEGYASVLLDGSVGELPSEVREVIERIQRSAGRLRKLTNDLLVLSRLRDPEDADVTEVSIADAVTRVVRELQAGLPSESRVSLEGTLPIVEAPAERIEQVLQNLIQNGLKYNSSATPTVVIDGWAEGSLAIVRVSDNGDGIPERDRDKVFELFTRLASDVPGTGAGLAIARRALRSLGGELWIESSSPKGTTFAFAVPLNYRNQEPRPSWQPMAMQG